jgi:hypothetical protein
MDPNDPYDLKSKLDKDADGQIIIRPLLRWITLPVAGTSVLLAVQYAETLEEAETRRGKQLQLILTPEQCLLVSERLTTLAKNILGDRLPPGKSPN